MNFVGHIKAVLIPTFGEAAAGGLCFPILFSAFGKAPMPAQPLIAPCWVLHSSMLLEMLLHLYAGAVAMSLQSLGSSEPGWDQDIPKEWSLAPRRCLVLSILSSSSLQLRCPQLTMGTPTVLRLQSNFGRTQFTTWHGPRLMGTQKKCKKMDMRRMHSA